MGRRIGPARRRVGGQDVMEVVRVRADGGLVTLGIEHEIPDLAALLRRARDLRPVYDQIKASGLLSQAKAYERDDRFRGGVGRPDRDGRRRNWGPGYHGHLRVSRTKRLLKANFRRHYPPTFTDQTVLDVTERILSFLVEATP